MDQLIQIGTLIGAVFAGAAGTVSYQKRRAPKAPPVCTARPAPCVYDSAEARQHRQEQRDTARDTLGELKRITALLERMEERR